MLSITSTSGLCLPWGGMATNREIPNTIYVNPGSLHAGLWQRIVFGLAAPPLHLIISGISGKTQISPLPQLPTACIRCSCAGPLRILLGHDVGPRLLFGPIGGT